MIRNTFIVTLLLVFILSGCSLPLGEFLRGPRPSDYSGILVIEWMDSGGTGFVVRDEGDTCLVVTAAHVVDINTHVFVDGILSEVVAVDYDTDVAILRVEKYERRWKVWRLDEAKVEEPARAVGYVWSYGVDPIMIVYRGYVTSLLWEDCVSFNGGVFPGLSGGPLLNSRRRVIGVCSRSPMAFGVPFETAALFVPSSEVQILLETIQ